MRFHLRFGRGTLFIAGAAAALLMSSPAPGGQDNTPFRFAVYGDTRDGHAVHRNIVAQIIKANPAFVLQTGDLVHSGYEEAHT